MLNIDFNKVIVTDIETDGLLDAVSKFHCAWTYDTSNSKWIAWRPHQLDQYVSYLDSKMSEGYSLALHNGIWYDIPALKKLTGHDFKNDPHKHVIDTLVLARLVWSNIKDIDVGLMRRGILPTKLFGSHSLKAYGYRLGVLKGTYGEQESAWANFNEDMLVYCKQDVLVTLTLLNKLLSKQYPQKAIELEHEIAWVMAKQERNGFCFDVKGAEKLSYELSARRADIEAQLVSTFGCWYVSKGVKTPKKDNKRFGYIEGAPYETVQQVIFNPSSRAHIAKALIARGWKPKEFTPTGAPKVDEEVLSNVDIPEAKLVCEYLMIQKRLGQVAEGDNAWLKLERNGKIHGHVNPNGAVTGRATHSYPNVAQVPSVRAEYGDTCRAFFGVPSGWLQAGVDASGLELRCFGHFLYPYDNGDYCHVILNEDIHTANQHAAGLPTRDQAKTFIYAYLYSAGDAKLGELVGGDASDGKKMKNQFLSANPAIAELRDAIEIELVSESKWTPTGQKIKWRKRAHPQNKQLDATKCLIGLDGRLLHVRSAHSALNTLLQSAGALICKKWVVLCEQNIRKAGYKHGWDGDFALMAWVHKQHCAR